MIPNFVTIEGSQWELLPAGVHEATLAETESRFSINVKRRRLFSGFKKGAEILFTAGCPDLFLDGSFVTAKPLPNDYEVLWNPVGVDPDLLTDQIFISAANWAREIQKESYFGEYIPSNTIEGATGEPFLSFFQKDKESGAPKGILKIKNWLTPATSGVQT